MFAANLTVHIVAHLVIAPLNLAEIAEHAIQTTKVPLCAATTTNVATLNQLAQRS